jgi:hypothetical protein
MRSSISIQRSIDYAFGDINRTNRTRQIKYANQEREYKTILNILEREQDINSKAMGEDTNGQRKDIVVLL